jgi:Rad3-related DNA helicase
MGLLSPVFINKLMSQLKVNSSKSTANQQQQINSKSTAIKSATKPCFYKQIKVSAKSQQQLSHSKSTTAD